MRSLKQIGALAVAFSIAMLASACGQWHAPSPIGPSNVTGPAAIPNAVPASGTATISGSVAGATRAHRVDPYGSSISTNITVKVVGTNVSTTVDILGRFVLEGVPTGSVQLHFSGAGVDATVNIGTVRERERVDVELTVNGTNATLQSSIRIEVDDSTEIEGPVTSVTGSCGNLQVTVHGWTVNLSATGVSCDSVRIGIRVRIRGTQTSPNVVVAVRIQVNTSPEDSDDDDGDD